MCLAVFKILLQYNSEDSDRLDTFWDKSLLHDTTEGRMLGKAPKGRKWQQMLSDVTSKTYEDLKEWSWRQEWMTEEIVINLPLTAEDQKIYLYIAYL